MEYQIITDSCCDLPAPLRRQAGVQTVPLTMRLGEAEFIDDDKLDLPAFMALMKACKAKVGSAAPSPSAYRAAFCKAGAAFAVTLSSQLSASYASAIAGKKLAEEDGAADVHVFDSKSASAGQALLALKIRELIDRKLSKSAIVEAMNRFIDGMKTYFALERYDNLQKNGRLNKVAGRIITILGIRLVMGADGKGNIALFHKARGEKQMLERMLDLIRQSGKKTEKERMVISHCNNPDLAGRLAGLIKTHFRFRDILVIPTGGLSSLYADNKGIVMAF